MIMNKDRDNIRELLSAYIDGEVTQEQSDAVENTVATDPELALELHELKSARSLLTTLPLERAPRGFVRKVMAQAERKHLLSDQQAGGAFSAARWITMAVAAVVLLTAGIGIIAVNILNSNQDPHTVVITDDGFGIADGLKNQDVNGRSLHDEGWKKNIKKRANHSVTGNSGIAGEKFIVTDAVIDYEITNATNTSIYTHDVSNTLAVLQETFDRNNVKPLKLEVSASEPKPADTDTAKNPDVSRGGLNFYYNNKHNDEQVQFVVLADNAVIEQLNGDLDKLASVQMVSQAPAPDLYKAKPNDGFAARRGGYRERRQGDGPSIRDEGEMTLARGDDVDTKLGATPGHHKAGKGVSIPAGSKITGEDPADRLFDGKKTPARPAPITPPKAAKPAVDTSEPAPKPPGQGVSQTGDTRAVNAPSARPDDPEKKMYELPDIDRSGLGRGKGSLSGSTTRPGDPMQIAGVIKRDTSGNLDRGERYTLSSIIDRVQKRLESGGLDNSARQWILNENIRRNVESQQKQGINVQALVININRRSLGTTRTSTTQRGILLNLDKILAKPGATTKSASESVESTTRQAPPPLDTNR
jgi:hypothetical protein